MGYEDDLNLYQYVLNDPLNLFDPMGERIEVQGSDEFKQRVAEDIEQVSQGEDNANWVADLEGSDQVITITESTNGNSIGYPGDPEAETPYAQVGPDGEPGTPTGATIFYDPSSTETAEGESRPAFVGLAHELGHAEDAIKGQVQPRTDNVRQGRTPPHERTAMQRENQVRSAHGLPNRESYRRRDRGSIIRR